MIVCHCHAKSDHEIRSAVRSGADSRRKVRRACAAGGSCGGCGPVIDEIIATERVEETSNFSIAAAFLADELATS